MGRVKQPCCIGSADSNSKPICEQCGLGCYSVLVAQGIRGGKRETCVCILNSISYLKPDDALITHWKCECCGYEVIVDDIYKTIDHLTNPNFTQPKITAATPPNGLTSNPTKGKSTSNSISSGTSSKTMNKTGGAAGGGNMSKAGGAAAGNTSSKVLTNVSKVVGGGLNGLGNLISPGKK